MMAIPITTSFEAAENMLAKAIHVLDETGDGPSYAALAELPAAIYVTDAEGLITYYNPACVTLAGRTPTLGDDRWCVTWKIYTDEGVFLPHDKCPMAEALLTGAAIRGVSAIAERPDGTRINFVPFPTPLFDPHGNVTGAVNLLLDVTAHRKAAALRDQARRSRRLATAIDDQQAASSLRALAEEYEMEADELLVRQTQSKLNVI
jgi:PAS domain-containing protein